MNKISFKRNNDSPGIRLWVNNEPTFFYYLPPSFLDYFRLADKIGIYKLTTEDEMYVRYDLINDYFKEQESKLYL